MTEFHQGLLLGLSIGALGLGVGIYVVIDATKAVGNSTKLLASAKQQLLADKMTMGKQKDRIHELTADLERLTG